MWKFGAQWASRNILRPRKAVLIGDVVAADKKRYAEPFCVAVRTDEGYIIRLMRKELDEFSLEGAAAAAAVDTPWQHRVEFAQ